MLNRAKGVLGAWRTQVRRWQSQISVDRNECEICQIVIAVIAAILPKLAVTVVPSNITDPWLTNALTN